MTKREIGPPRKVVARLERDGRFWWHVVQPATNGARLAAIVSSHRTEEAAQRALSPSVFSNGG